MKKTTLLNIMKRYHLEEAAVGTLFWEAAQEDAEEHFIGLLSPPIRGSGRKAAASPTLVNPPR